MKFLTRPWVYATAMVALLMPSAGVRSQLAPLPDDPLAALQSLQKTNDDLLKRQDDTMKVLTDLTNTANEVRLFTHRG